MPSKDELKTLITSIYSDEGCRTLAEIVGLIANTGIRAGELARLRWRDVDLSHTHGSINIISAKSGGSRKVPLNGAAGAILRLRRQKAPATEFVLGASPNVALRRAILRLSTVSESLFGRRLRLKDIRESFFKRWIECGGNQYALALITGYSIRSVLHNLLTNQQLYNLAAQEIERTAV